MVTLQGALVPVPEEPALLFGVSDSLGDIAAVKLDDGREFLVARKDIEEPAPDTEREALP